jgi:hypothetical protein
MHRVTDVAAAAEVSVATNVLVAGTPSLSAFPALKPNHPNQTKASAGDRERKAMRHRAVLTAPSPAADDDHRHERGHA